MADRSATSPAPVLFGGFVLFLIICVLAYVAFGPGGEESGTAGSGTPGYPGAPVSGEPVTTASGLKYYDLEVGDGRTPGAASRVSTHYTGWLLSGAKFDSSVDRGEPFAFSLAGGVIEGWIEGVRSMKVGGKRKLIIPPHLGYGQEGRPPKIPPGSTLVFDIELLEILE